MQSRGSPDDSQQPACDPKCRVQLQAGPCQICGEQSCSLLLRTHGAFLLLIIQSATHILSHNDPLFYVILLIIIIYNFSKRNISSLEMVQKQRNM